MARGILGIIPAVFNGISLLFCCLILFSGFNGALTQIYWMKTDTSGFSLPSALASSEYLQAISSVSKTDFVGGGRTAASLGLPEWSGIHLFTECAHYGDGRVECTKPQYSLAFRPGRDWKIDSDIQELSSTELEDALELFSKSSRFVSGGFIASAFLSVIALIEAFLVPLWACFTSGFATILLFAATVTATVVYTKLSKALNTQLEQYHMPSKLGIIPVAFGFVAFALTLLATALYIINYRRRTKIDGMGRAVGGDGSTAYMGSGHKYVQIDEQRGTAAAVPGRTGRMGARDVSPDSATRAQRLDDDWAAPDEYSSTTTGPAKTSSGPSANIPLMPLGGNKQTKDLNTAYEPFSDPR